ncbi:MAG TPA: hypothetical protein VHN14_07820 [Kofleriaceae bacterium]|jgi:hypothetical protein|nr:hypothetical protein [Kofleriaceae bacterium]
MRLIGAMILLGACHIGSEVGPDTPAEPGHDAQYGLGMFVSWTADPSLPGGLTDKITVSDVTFQVDHFQILGDAGSITHSKYLLAWGAATAPEQDVFPDAPPGVYSKVALVMMGGSFGEDAFRVRGIWRDNGIPKQFEIHDPHPLSISIDCNATLPVAGSAMIGIRVNLEAALSGVNYKNLDVEDGILELQDGPELAGFRGRLQKAFDLDL